MKGCQNGSKSTNRKHAAHGQKPHKDRANEADRRGGEGHPQGSPPAKIKFIPGEWKQLEFSFAVEEHEEETRDKQREKDGENILQ